MEKTSDPLTGRELERYRHMTIKTRHYNALWRILNEKRYFVMGWRQAFWLRRLLAESFVRFFRAIQAPVAIASTTSPPVARSTPDPSTDPSENEPPQTGA